MTRIIISFVILCVYLLPANSAEVDISLKSTAIDLSNKASLQRGARLYMNYCSGCHSLRYMRYNKMAKGLGLTTFDGTVDKDLLKNNLIFTASNIHDPIRISMPEEDARQWFGRMPPDLSLSAKARGANWLYTYLKSFYVDTSRPFGANNLLVPDVAMPNILAPLQGTVVARRQGQAADETAPATLILIQDGQMSQHQFDSALNDLITFLVYVSEPDQLLRYRIGIFIIIFLGIFAFVAYRLKKVYWRRLH